MKYLILVSFLLLSFITVHKASAQTQTPSIFYCVGDNPQPPCVTRTPSPSGTTITSEPSVSPSTEVTNPVTSTNPSPSVVISTIPSTSPSTSPCTTQNAAVSSKSTGSVQALQHGHGHKGKKHSSGGKMGFLQQFILLLLQLLQLIFKQLGITLPVPTGPCPTPSPVPSGTPSNSPSSGVSPSVAPSGTTTAPSIGVPTPTIFGVSPSPTTKPTTKPTAKPPTPTSGTVSANCTKGGSYLWSNLVSCGWPGTTNTGPVMSACSNGLTANGSSPTQTITFGTANQVISCEKITGMVRITAKNVTIKNSTISANSGKTGENANGTGAIFIEDGASAIIDHNTINGNNGVHACIWDQGDSMTATYNNCTGMNDGIFSWADTSYSQNTGDNFDIENNYLHGFTTATANGHIDGYQTEGAKNGTIRHNTIDVSQDQDSDVAIWNSLKSSSNITVDNNLMAGGGFAIYVEDYSPSESNPSGGFTVTNIKFTNNKFSTIHFGCVGSFGVWFSRGNPSDQWNRSGNIVLETGQNVDKGNPTNNGAACN